MTSKRLKFSGHTLDAIALVHEAYLRLVGDQQFDGRGHFFAAAAEAMRRILVDAARGKLAEKHGGNSRRVDMGINSVIAPSRSDGVIALNEALTGFAKDEPEIAAIVNLRYFAGLTIDQAVAA